MPLCLCDAEPDYGAHTDSILQYRPPIENVCVELPAGLIDEGESPEQAAVRELYEETGYGGDDFEGRVKVTELGSTIVSDPGEPSPSSLWFSSPPSLSLLREPQQS